jgi:hypothetical protein
MSSNSDATSRGRNRRRSRVRPRLEAFTSRSFGRRVLVWRASIQAITARDGSRLLLATVRVREEKGSDVNVATHLLADVFRGEVEAAIVISNDSDLALPLEIARTLVPVGTVNPGTKPLAGALRGLPNEGAGRHWWGTLSARQYYNNQMPDPVGRWSKPLDW